MYNGHKNWTHWNVSLWIGNDEGLYRLADETIKRCATRDKAARKFLRMLHEDGITKTPDGARYSFPAVRAAFSGWTD